MKNEERKKERVLVVAAHADDEALGCGGTIARHIAKGDSVHVIFLTDGVGSRNEDCSGATDAVARVSASIAALAVLGVEESNVTSFSFPDNALDSVPRLEVVKAIESVISQVQPEVVYTHHAGDLNVDHRYAYEATMTACRPQPGSSVKEIYSYEVPSSTGWLGVSYGCPFVPTRYISIGGFLKTKVEALEAYIEEMHPFPHARSFEAVKILAKHRGSQVGVPAAEAFVVERVISD
ncbi:PIG-L family deacetylase [Akkermansiaceae bacterium]|nr:PIG-L family deacetylase [Akkermansiaceae bacterium]